jgi:hypothetical protein
MRARTDRDGSTRKIDHPHRQLLRCECWRYNPVPDCSSYAQPRTNEGSGRRRAPGGSRLPCDRGALPMSTDRIVGSGSSVRRPMAAGQSCSSRCPLPCGSCDVGGYLGGRAKAQVTLRNNFPSVSVLGRQHSRLPSDHIARPRSCVPAELAPVRGLTGRSPAAESVTCRPAGMIPWWQGHGVSRKDRADG